MYRLVVFLTRRRRFALESKQIRSTRFNDGTISEASAFSAQSQLSCEPARPERLCKEERSPKHKFQPYFTAAEWSRASRASENVMRVL